MANDVFSQVMSFMIEKGVLNIFLWMLLTAIFYGVLRRSKIFGDSVVINGLIALIASFFISALPYLTGFQMLPKFVLYITQIFIIAFAALIGVVIASIFYPDLQNFLKETFTHRTTLWVFIAVGIVFLVTSGLISIFTDVALQATSSGKSPDIPVLMGALFIFLVLILVASGITRGTS